MRPILRFSTAALLMLGCIRAQALDFDEPNRQAALQAVKNIIMDAVSASVRDGKPKSMKLASIGFSQPVELTSADELGLGVRMNKAVVTLMWKRISVTDIAAMARVCVDSDISRANALADYCACFDLRAMAEEARNLALQLKREQVNQSVAELRKIPTEGSAPEAFDSSGSPRPARAPIKLAFRPSTPEALTPESEVASALDNVIEIEVNAMGLTPTPVCDDLTFLRRVSLDINGLIPSPEEVLTFYKDTTVNKREKKVQELLNRVEYADHWATQLQNSLTGRQLPDMFDNHAPELRSWLRGELKKNEPFDKMAKAMLTANGSNGPAHYLSYHLQNSTLPLAIDHVSRDFLAKRIACAQCHDHPFDRWTQQDFWGFAAFLSRTSGGYNGVQDQEERLTGPKYDTPDKEFLLKPRIFDQQTPPEFDEPNLPPPPVNENQQKRRMQRQEAAPKPPEQMAGFVYRKQLADYVTAPENRDFDRAAVNRIWKHFFGYGLIEPVDDIRPKNGATHPQVLDILADDFAASGRDLKRLMTVLASTKAYQRSSSGKASKIERHRAVRYAARAEIRPMTPEMLFMAILKATSGEEKARDTLAAMRATPEELAAMSIGKLKQLDPSVQEFYQLLQRFFAKSAPNDSNANLQFEGSFTQALMMMHSDLMNRAIRDAVSRYERKGMDMTYLFALTLGRPPTQAEQTVFSQFKGELEQILWVLLNSAEFVTIR